MNSPRPNRLAIIREVSPSIGQCELTHLPRSEIDFETAKRQHAEYCNSLANLGFDLRRLPPSPELPDSVFVEDICVVLGEIAIITRPGVESRRAEVDDIAHAMAAFRELRFIEAPATLDGGDILQVGRQLFVGQSKRTNEHGLSQMRDLAKPLGYSVIAAPISGCLHLKSAVTAVSDRILLVNSNWVEPTIFGRVELIHVDPDEPMAANALLAGEVVIYPKEFPKTRRRLESRGIRVIPVETSELAKAEGGVTCCSIILC